MSSPQNCLPTLVVDSDSAAANSMAEALRRDGFEVDVATGCPAARTAMQSRHYGTLVLAVDLRRRPDLDCLAGLRRLARRTWIVVISSLPCSDAHGLAFQHGADSLLVAPFAIEDLTFRVAAFSHRSRPP